MDSTADRLNYYRTLQDLDITTNGRYRYRTLQHITTANRLYCYRTVQHKDTIAMDSTATEYYNTWIPSPIEVTATVHYSKLTSPPTDVMLQNIMFCSEHYSTLSLSSIEVTATENLCKKYLSADGCHSYRELKLYCNMLNKQLINDKNFRAITHKSDRR